MSRPTDRADELSPLAKCLRIAHARGEAIRRERERRDPREQAAILLRETLIERGLLPADSSTPIGTQPAESQAARDA